MDLDLRANPWRESFKTLYRGMHVRPGAKRLYADKPALLLKPTRPPALIQTAPMPGDKALSSSSSSSSGMSVAGGAVPKMTTSSISGAGSAGNVGGVRTEVAPVESMIRRPGRRVGNLSSSCF